MNAGICGPPNIASGNVACTGPCVPWYAAIEPAPFARCCAFGGENVSACRGHIMSARAAGANNEL